LFDENVHFKTEDETSLLCMLEPIIHLPSVRLIRVAAKADAQAVLNPPPRRKRGI
jgi:hypothetical protein